MPSLLQKLRNPPKRRRRPTSDLPDVGLLMYMELLAAKELMEEALQAPAGDVDDMIHERMLQRFGPMLTPWSSPSVVPTVGDKGTRLASTVPKKSSNGGRVSVKVRAKQAG